MTSEDHEMQDDPRDDAAAFDDWDEIDWSQVDELQHQIDDIEGIEDPKERKEAAKRWAAAMSEGTN